MWHICSHWHLAALSNMDIALHLCPDTTPLAWKCVTFFKLRRFFATVAALAAVAHLQDGDR
jgi:hypothetical protein